MKYDNITRATFLRRPNRFIAEVELDDHWEIVHVKNTGRCRELLIPGCEVWLTEPGTPGRKTRYDLVAVRKESGVLFNIDSQAVNKVTREWLSSQTYSKVVPEYTYGDSRLDFYMEQEAEFQPAEQAGPCDSAGPQQARPARTAAPAPSGSPAPQRFLMEVKGCTLEIGGIGYFPDAPTERGVKHIRELIRAREEGYEAILAFVIQMDGVTEVRPNIKTHPAFGDAMDAARAAGVKILFLCCHVEPGELTIVKAIYDE